MERLFSPCTRYRDLLESQQGREGFIGTRGPSEEGMQEINLDVSTDEFLSAEMGFTYADVHAMLGNGDTLAWLTPHAAVGSGTLVKCLWKLDGSCRFRFGAEGKDIYALARSPEHLLEICDVVLRWLAASVVHSVILHEWSCCDGTWINAPTLAYLMEQCQSLKVLTLVHLEMDENHCRVLGDYSRPDLEIVLSHCKITSAGTSALAELLGSNQGPTKLDRCEIDYSVIGNGLRGNSRLKSLTPWLAWNRDAGNHEVLAIAGALKENKGLDELDLSHYSIHKMGDETWDAVCDSLKTHPTLQVLNLRARLSPTKLKSRVQTLVDMLKGNMSIHTICIHDRCREHELFQGSVIPYLEANKFRPRVRAIQKTCPIAYRAKVLGRALLAARTDANSFWMLLSGNAEVALSLTTATTTAATNPPTPTAATTSNSAAMAATAAATVTPTRASTTKA